MEYIDRDGADVNEGDVTVYVYDARSHARAAFADACRHGCIRRVNPAGFPLKYHFQRYHGLPSAAIVGTCGNLYLAVITASSTETANQVAFDAAYLVGALYAKARNRGLSRC